MCTAASINLGLQLFINVIPEYPKGSKKQIFLKIFQTKEKTVLTGLFRSHNGSSEVWDADRGKVGRLQAKGCLRLSCNSCDLWLRGWLSCGAAELLAALLLWHNPRLLAHFELCSGWRCVALTKELSVAQSRRVQLTAQVALCGLCCSALCNLCCLIPFLVKTCKYILSDWSLHKPFATPFISRLSTMLN